MPALTARGAGIMLGAETTYGTAVARTVSRPVRSVALQTNLEQTAVPDLYSGTAATSRRHHKARTTSGGSVSMVLAYDAMGLILKSALGAAATTGTGPYTHTYTLANALPSLTIDVIRGNSTNGEIFEGCIINTLTLSGSPGDVVTCDLDIIAETSAARSSAATLSITEKAIVLGSNAGQFGFGGNNNDLSSFRLTVNNNVERRPTLGSLTTAEPNRSGNMSVTMEVTLACVGLNNDTFLAAQLADTNGDATITFTSAATSDRSLAITLHNAWIESATDPVNDAGVITQSLVLRGESDGTDLGLKIVAINGNSSAIGN